MTDITRRRTGGSVQRLVRGPLLDPGESRGAEEYPGAVVAGAAELCGFDGHETSQRPKGRSV